MTIEKDEIRACWVISDIIGGYMVTRRYYYYTKKEAIDAFTAEFKS